MAARLKIFFQTETFTYGEEEARETVTVSQLMPAGAMLVALDESDHSTDINLVPGDFVEYSADKRALLAAMAGYPQMVRIKEAAGEKVIVDLEPLFLVSEDCWTVKMTLYPAISGSVLPDAVELVEMLKKTGACWGVREKRIDACVAAVQTEQRPCKNQVIARGRLPVNGENARLRVDIAVGEQVGKEFGDGSMDFRERHFFTGVDAGQLLATKVKATKGLPGINVYGHEVLQTAGKDLEIKTADDIIYNEETGEIHAAIAGVLSVVSETSVRVTAKLVISGDIDFQTGNVESRNAVQIGGSIKPGFKLTAGGDVMIGGSVETAQVISRGNVVIRGGITGEKAIVEAEGDVDIPVINNGVISCKGTLRVAREAYYAEIRCLHDVVFTGQAQMVSCDVFAGGSITVINVDTDTSPNSLLAAAIMPERYTRYLKLLKGYHQAQAAVEAWQRRFGAHAAGDELAELKEELADAKTSLASYNLVLGVGERDRSGGLRYACRQKIIVKGMICSGALIRIGNTETRLKKSFSEGHFALNSDTGAIEFHADNKGLITGAVQQV